ncbi:MAG: hypothetical protein JWP32_2230 [Schumannella sp.]|nr:hypothetical protein [Schumannella sp.]
MPGEESPRARGNGAGVYALVFGLAAVVCVFIPIVGDYIAAPLAVFAIALGFVGIRRHETGRATGPASAIIGALLGAASAAVTFMMYAATHLAG